MNVWVRRAGILLACLVAVLLLAIGAVYVVSTARLGSDHEMTAHAFDPATGNVVEGEHLARTYGCMECHGTTLGGTLLIDGMPFARLPAPNLTSGRADGGLTDEQWELSVRHGIGADGRGLFVMPSSHYVYLSDSDLADIVAYIRTVPPVTDDLPERAFGPVGRMLITLGQLRAGPEMMQADAQHLAAPIKAPTPEFGYYLTRLCTGCHGQDLAGAMPAQPDAPPAPNLTPAGNLANWTFEQFEQAMRTGQTPEGMALDPEFMPWTAIGQGTHTELRAMWEYLMSLQPATAETTS